jgi:hypothetical protein
MSEVEAHSQDEPDLPDRTREDAFQQFLALRKKLSKPITEEEYQKNREDAWNELKAEKGR